MFYPLLLLGSIIFLDLCLSGDNVVVIAMVTNGLPEKLRPSALNAGMVLAAALRIVLALFATFLLRNHWIGFLGGVALLYVGYKLVLQVVNKPVPDDPEDKADQARSFGQALLLIMLADLSMSLDNVLAVAALARHHFFLMIVGIAASIYFLTVASRWVAKILTKYPWVNWVGIGLIFYVALGLIFGSYDVTIGSIQQ